MRKLFIILSSELREKIEIYVKIQTKNIIPYIIFYYFN